MYSIKRVMQNAFLTLTMIPCTLVCMEKNDFQNEESNNWYCIYTEACGEQIMLKGALFESIELEKSQQIILFKEVTRGTITVKDVFGAKVSDKDEKLFKVLFEEGITVSLADVKELNTYKTMNGTLLLRKLHCLNEGQYWPLKVEETLPMKSSFKREMTESERIAWEWWDNIQPKA